MSYIINNLTDYTTFWANLPTLYNGQNYQMNCHYDVNKNKIIPDYFEYVDELGHNSIELIEGWYPPEFEEAILKAAKKIHEEIVANEEPDVLTYDDYLAQKADKDEDRDESRDEY
jgi:lipoate-protein ligase A